MNSNLILDKIIGGIKYSPGDMIYLVTDPDQLVRMITEIRIRMNGGVAYEVSVGSLSTIHYAGELSFKRDLELTEEQR